MVEQVEKTAVRRKELNRELANYGAREERER